MRTVIAEYETLVAATQAVRALELHISTQSIVIGDQREHRWRRRDLKRDRTRDGADSANFIVCMSGTPESIGCARTLLHSRETKQISQIV